MPERWERELSKLRGLDAHELRVRERVARGPSTREIPSRRERVIAGAVAGVVAIAAAALLWQTLPGNRGQVGGAGVDLPVLAMRFHDSEVISEGPDSSYRRVLTTIAYGDSLDESHTSTTPEGALVEWAAAEDLTRFTPGPTVGSAVDFRADGDDPRVLLGRPQDWPSIDAFTPIDHLPDVPGEYVLVFEASYPEGIARTARLVQLVEPSVLQLALTEGGKSDAATGSAYVDGRATAGFLSSSSFTEGDFGINTVPQAPTFAPGAWLDVLPGSPITVAGSPTTATSEMFESYEAFEPEGALPNDLLHGATAIDAPVGRRLLAVEATWVHPAPGTGDYKTTERALFFFPIEVVDPAPVDEEPSPSPTPSPTPTGVVSIDIRRSDGSASGDPRAIATFGDQEVSMCPNGWSLVEPDGTSKGWVIMDCDQDEEFLVPAGTPITLSGEDFVVDVTARDREGGTRYATNQAPGIDVGSEVILTYEVEWEDGSEASFWLRLTVSEGPPTAEASVLKVRCGTDGAEILTPVVIAQPDGVHLEVENTAGAAAVEFSLADAPNTSFGGPIGPAVSVWPIEPGSVFVECLAKMSDTGRGLRTARFEVTDPNGYWVGGGLECEEGDRSLEVSVHDALPTDYPDDETAIRGSLHSVQPSDEVRLPFYPEGGGSKDGRYIVVRDGRVVAFLFIGLSDETDRYGPGLTEVTGEACASSGIAQGSLS
jgi:hypothetical protein